MSEASLDLASLAGNSLPGLDVAQVENERKDMWRNLFQKFENMADQDISEEVTLEDIDNPEMDHNKFKAGRFSMQSNSTLKRYIRDHADEMDEIATIAGPPVSDEEVLSDDSDEELLCEDSEASNDTIEGAVQGDIHRPLTPVSSTASELNTAENSENDSDYGEHSEKDATLSEHIGDLDATLVDSDDDYNLYIPDTMPLPQNRSIFEHPLPKSPSEEPVDKKPRLVSPSPSPSRSPHSSCQRDVSREDVGHDDQSSDDETIVKTKDNDSTNGSLVCSKCNTSTFYQALMVTELEFVCDECMVGDHRDCEVEECEVCKEVGELIRFRRSAEVMARVQKKEGSGQLLGI